MKTTNNQTKSEFILAAALVAIGIGTRLLFSSLHIYNFNAVLATTLFAGAFLRRSKWGYIVPLAVMLVTDAFLGFYDAQQMAVVYLSYTAVLVIGALYAKKPSLLGFIGVSVGGSLAFFLVTNFAFMPFYHQYPHTLAGMIESYTLALPFYKNSLMSDLLFSGILFGGFEAAKVFVPNKKLALAN